MTKAVCCVAVTMQAESGRTPRYGEASMGSANEQLDPKAEQLAAKVAYVGLGTVFKGEISVPELLVIEGNVEGDVRTQTLRVGTNGVIKGKVFANNADIHGVLAEDVEVEDFLLLRSSSRTEGHVKCGNVQVERGAAIKGDFWTGVEKSAEVNVNNVEPLLSGTRHKVQAAE